MSPRNRSRHYNPGSSSAWACWACIVLIAVLAPILFTAQANALGPRFAPPSPDHWLGTDAAGHDVLLRSLVATRLTLLMTAGCDRHRRRPRRRPGHRRLARTPRARELCLRVIDAMVAFPGLLLALVVAAVLGAGGSSARDRHRAVRHPLLRPPHREPRREGLPAGVRLDRPPARREPQPRSPSGTCCPTWPSRCSSCRPRPSPPRSPPSPRCPSWASASSHPPTTGASCSTRPCRHSWPAGPSRWSAPPSSSS